MPEVSVVIPLFNKGPFIVRALNSVLKQTFQDFEVIVVDDGSTDNGASVVKEFKDSRIRMVQQENRGVSAARNNGVELAQAKLIAFIDADDEWEPRFLETILRLTENYPEAGIYCTAFNNYHPGGKVQRTRQVIVPPPPWEGIVPHYFLSAALNGPSVSASSSGVPKKILEEFNGFASKSWYGEDVDLWGRIALKYPIAFSWYEGAVYHEDAPDRACSQLKPVRNHPFLITVCEAISQGEVPDDILPDLMEYVAALKLSLAARNVCLGEPGLARPFLKGCDTKIFRRQKIFWKMCSHIPPGLFLFFRRALHQARG